MHYYRHLYVQESLKRRQKKIMSGLENGKYRPDVHLIVLPSDPQEQLEILDTAQFRQKNFPVKDYFVIGIAKDQGDAVKMVAEIVEQVYNETGGTDIRSYIMNQEQEDV